MTDRDPMLVWPESGPPHSRRFDDRYFSETDGLAEARAVFLEGCGLPQAWRGRRRFTVGELGFGTGLNIAALIDLWAREGPAEGHLSIFTVDAFPVSSTDARRALRSWPELAEAAQALLAAWPGAARGFHRLELPRFRARIDVAVMEAGEALTAWSGAADAWFLDGFAPARNPLMWRAEVLDLVARRSAPGARLATYTAAGEVRRGLAGAGFNVRRVSGFAGKRHRLEADAPGAPPPERNAGRIAIIGAGVAGAALARALAADGTEPLVMALDAPPASAGRAALVAPRLDAGLGPQAALFAQAAARAGSVYARIPGAVLAQGAMQLATRPKDPARFSAIAGSDLFETGAMTRLGCKEAAERLGETAPVSLFMAGARVIGPATVLAHRTPAPLTAAITRLERTKDGIWRLFDADGRLVTETEIVCLAAGAAGAALAPELPIRAVRGQASYAAGVESPVAILFGGYVAATPAGAIFGATHDRDDAGLEAREEDHKRNLRTVAAAAPRLADRLAAAPLEAFVGIRATTPDFLPIAGEIAPGLFTLTGLGSRGFTLAPLLAEHVTALILGAPSPLPEYLAALVEPGRFARRAQRRGRAGRSQ